MMVRNDDDNLWDPVQALEKLVIELESRYKKSKDYNEFLQEKTDEFKKETKEKLEDTLKSFHVLDLLSDSKDLPDSEKIRGGYAIIKKDPYIIFYSHAPFFGTEIVEALSETINKTILSSFETSNTTRYLLIEDDIFPAVDRLGLTKDHIILVMGSLDAFKQRNIIEGLSDDAYKKTPLYSFGSVDLMGFHLYILKKKDLPYFDIIPEPSRHITSDSQLKISEDYHIFATLLDLDHPPDINYEELQLSKEIYSLKNWLALSLDFEAELKYNKKAEVIHLELYSEHLHSENTPHQLEEIKSISLSK